jgi:hypothetical protein
MTAWRQSALKIVVEGRPNGILSGPGHLDLEVLSALSNSDFSKGRLYHTPLSGGKMTGVSSLSLRCVEKMRSLELPLLLRLKCIAREFATATESAITLLFSFSMMVLVAVGRLIDLTLRQISAEEVLVVIVER